MSTKAHDIIVFGATSFVGKLVADYMVKQFSGAELSWALAARSEAKLNSLKAELGAEAADIPCLLADAADEQSLRALCDSGRVIISTVGPYALYGESLVRACAESGTHYCDLTGEVQWIRRMVQNYQSKAEASGARIVHCCGFDSIPSDLGVNLLQQEAQQQWGQPASRIHMRVQKMRGGVSGGTVASMVNLAKEMSKDPSLRKELANPYSICPDDHPFKARQARDSVRYDSDIQSWLAPFIMASINTRVVHRSNALLGSAYGDNFQYNEAISTGDGLRGRLRAISLAAGVGATMLGVALGPTRSLLEKFVLPKPGEGPSPEQIRNGSYDLLFIAENDSSEQLRHRVTGDSDPGYGSTAKMLAQAAACIAFDLDDSTAGGIWTPAALMAQPLAQRLRDHAGMTFDGL